MIIIVLIMFCLLNETNIVFLHDSLASTDMTCSKWCCDIATSFCWQASLFMLMQPVHVQTSVTLLNHSDNQVNVPDAEIIQSNSWQGKLNSQRHNPSMGDKMQHNKCSCAGTLAQQIYLLYLLPPVLTLQAGWLHQILPASPEQSSLSMPAAHNEAA